MTSADPEPFQLHYLLASSMYGRLPLAQILPEVAKTGARGIDIWREGHANQREQIADMGLDAFRGLLKQHHVTLDCTTIWNLPFADECRFLQQCGGRLLVTGFIPDTEPEKFLEKLRPQLEVAAETGVTVCFENHGGGFNAIRAFAETAESFPQVKIALAPYHLPQDADALGKLIRDIGPKLGLFYAWQHGDGAMKKLPKEQELKQLPGRGGLDFTPMLAGAQEIQFTGPTEIFMHPVPRGIPILETAAAVTAEINRARDYLTGCLKAI
ncbi:MAG: sugar phosphate isomerase/epimerase [Planctomycetaceae bacterium]